MFGAVKPGFRSLATLKVVYSECHWRTLNRKLEIWGRAQREAARRRKSDWKDNFGGSNSARINATWRVNCVSLHSTRTVGLGYVNMRAYNFFVC